MDQELLERIDLIERNVRPSSQARMGSHHGALRSNHRHRRHSEEIESAFRVTAFTGDLVGVDEHGHLAHLARVSGKLCRRF